MASKAASATKPRPKIFRALGSRDLPANIGIAGESFALVDPLKHDSWAATGLYAGSRGKVICKFNREQNIFGLPMRWLGRALARREAEFLRRTADVPNLPRGCGPVTMDGTVRLNAVARVYVEGHPLGANERVGDDFFPQLRLTFDEIHRRGLAHVDLHKRENIIVADDGRPCLIDFQICWLSPEGFWGRTWPFRAVLHLLQRADNYHFIKHVVRHRPDQLPPGQRDMDSHRPWFIKLHRHALSIPFRALRRRLLVLLSVRSGKGMAESEVAPEDAVRREMNAAVQPRGNDGKKSDDHSSR
jgi:hypothetical protein